MSALKSDFFELVWLLDSGLTLLELLEAMCMYNILKVVSNNVMHEASLFLVQAPLILLYEINTNVPKPIMMINLEGTDDQTYVYKRLRYLPLVSFYFSRCMDLIHHSSRLLELACYVNNLWCGNLLKNGFLSYPFVLLLMNTDEGNPIQFLLTPTVRHTILYARSYRITDYLSLEIVVCFDNFLSSS